MFVFIFKERNRIVNGKECSVNQWPWAVVLGRLRSGSSSIRVMCGGTLITKRHVLSAAHCFTSKSSVNLIMFSNYVEANFLDISMWYKLK